MYSQIYFFLWTTSSSVDNFQWILTDYFERRHKELRIFLSTALKTKGILLLLI